jgi:hypothetical protein
MILCHPHGHVVLYGLKGCLHMMNSLALYLGTIEPWNHFMRPEPCVCSVSVLILNAVQMVRESAVPSI